MLLIAACGGSEQAGTGQPSTALDLSGMGPIEFWQGKGRSYLQKLVESSTRLTRTGR